MRSGLALQLLASAAGSVVGYYSFKQCGVLQILLGFVVVAIGVLGFGVVLALERAADIHIRRARAARACLPRIDAFAKGANGKAGFLPLSRYYRVLTLLIGFVGLTLVGVTVRDIREWSALTQCKWDKASDKSEKPDNSWPVAGSVWQSLAGNLCNSGADAGEADQAGRGLVLRAAGAAWVLDFDPRPIVCLSTKIRVRDDRAGVNMATATACI